MKVSEKLTHESNGPLQVIVSAGALAILKSDPRGKNSAAWTFKLDPSGVPIGRTNLLLASKSSCSDVDARTSGDLLQKKIKDRNIKGK